MDFFKRTYLFLKDSTRFFEELKKEKGMDISFFYLVTCLFIILSISFVGGIVKGLLSGLHWGSTSILKSVLIILAIYVLLLVVFFIQALFLTWYLKFFGAKTSLDKTFQLVVYSAIPSFLFALIPIDIVGKIGNIIAMIMLWKGTKIVYKISWNAVLLAYLIVPFGLLILALIVVWLLGFAV